MEIQNLLEWNSRTKIRFQRKGDSTSYGKAQDILFVIEEKLNLVFHRERNDLIAIVNMPFIKALAGRGVREEDGYGRRVQVIVVASSSIPSHSNPPKL